MSPNRHDMSLAVKVGLNRTTINHPTNKPIYRDSVGLTKWMLWINYRVIICLAHGSRRYIKPPFCQKMLQIKLIIPVRVNDPFPTLSPAYTFLHDTDF